MPSLGLVEFVRLCGDSSLVRKETAQCSTSVEISRAAAELHKLAFHEPCASLHYSTHSSETALFNMQALFHIRLLVVWSENFFILHCCSTTRRYASAVLSMALCMWLSQVEARGRSYVKTAELIEHGHGSLRPHILHCVTRKYGYIKHKGTVLPSRNLF